MKAKILIAEDDPDIRGLIRLHLQKEGHTVLEAADGLTALKLIEKDAPQLIILDIMMPQLTGLDVLQTLRATRETPVIMLTARGEDSDKVLGLDLGADDYLPKPFSVLELMSRVRAQLRRAYAFGQNDLKPQMLTNGPITMDEAQHLVQVNDTPVALNPTEFKILSLFMKSPGRVFTKQQIYEGAWEETYYGDDNTIMVHISHLRDKLEDDPKKPRFIQTIRGVGYRMERFPS